MYCPVCGHEDTRVVDSRLGSEGDAIRRRRECDRCGYRFSTLEEIELLDLVVVKQNGSREAYKREKIERGLRKALEKRPVTDAAFRSLMHGVERDIQRRNANEVMSREIGEIVMERLKGFDTVAYIRFASVYRKFEDARTFQKELEGLLRSARSKQRSGKKKGRA